MHPTSNNSSPRVTAREKTLLNLLNKLAIVVFVTTCVLLFIGVVFNFNIHIEHSITMIICVLLVLYFNSRGKLSYSSHIAAFVFPLLMGYVMITSDSNFAMTNVFLVCGLVVFILYENQLLLQIISMLYLLLVGVGTLVYILLYKQNYHIDLNPYNDLIVFISCIIGLSYLLTIYQGDINSARENQNTIANALKLKNNELERFAYVTSHDLKEPVRNIENLSKFVKSSLKAGKGGQRNKEMIRMIKDSSAKLSSLIDSILKYSKLEDKEIPFERVDLNQVIQDFMRSHTNIMEAKDKELSYDILPAIQGNRDFISLLFQNLIENGFKYNTSDIKKVKLKAVKRKSNHLITIADNGIGVDQNFKEYIFEPFKRLHNNDTFKGSGLGLSICKKIVDMHGGEIWVEDNPNGGSIFYLNLPF